MRLVDIYICRVPESIDGDMNSAVESTLPQSFIDRISSSSGKLRCERLYAYSLLYYAVSRHGIIPHKCKLLFSKGRPYIENSGFTFSISHSGGYVSVAISSDFDSLGIDIELFSDESYKTAQKAARRFFGGVYFDPYSLPDYLCTSDDLDVDYITREKKEKPRFTLSLVNVFESNKHLGFSSEGIKTISGLEDNSLSLWCGMESVMKAHGGGFGDLSQLPNILSFYDIFVTSLPPFDAPLYLAVSVDRK